MLDVVSRTVIVRSLLVLCISLSLSRPVLKLYQDEIVTVLGILLNIIE